MSITVQLSKEKYIYGVDTHIEGTIELAPDITSQDIVIEIEHTLLSGITDEILTEGEIENIDKSDLEESSIDSCELTRSDLSFRLPITQPNLYGNNGISEDNNGYTVIIHCLTVICNDIDFETTFHIKVEWPELEKIGLKSEEERINTNYEEPEDEVKFDPSRGIKVLWDYKLISNEAYNDEIGMSGIVKFGKFLFEFKPFGIIFGLLFIGIIPYIFYRASGLEFNVLENVPFYHMDIIYILVIVFFLFLRFFFITGFKDEMERRCLSLDLREDDEGDDEEYFQKCFQGPTLKLKQVFSEDAYSPLYPIHVSGKVRISAVLSHEYTISKGNYHDQTILDKNIIEFPFSSLNALLEKEIELPKWVQDMARIDDNTYELTSEIYIDISYDGLVTDHEIITLLGI